MLALIWSTNFVRYISHSKKIRDKYDTMFVLIQVPIIFVRF
jgi:NO-binding membrane sensor protein with MHYT domain